MNGVSALLKGTIRAYQYLLAPVLPAVCRHYPSCSRYAVEAIDRFGPLTGGWLAIKRLARCHPWGGEGVDPVPDADASGPVIPPSRVNAEHMPSRFNAANSPGRVNAAQPTSR